ncbi:MAG TPA: hypothetical protein VG269_22785 [Tepidisphaeraceae bacterium]|nr:hypothetical protein [Tepidisphaeraceae bacterium]
MTVKRKHAIYSVAAIFSGLTGFGCNGTMRDNFGTVHDGSFVLNQSKQVVTTAPLLMPFIPPALVFNGVKGAMGNGKIQIDGVVVGEDGKPLDDVTLFVADARLVTFDVNNDAAVFWEQTSTNDINGRFAVNLGNTHTVFLEFAKDGYESRQYQYEINSDGLSRDMFRPTVTPVYHASPLVESGLRVMMKRQPQTAAATQAAPAAGSTEEEKAVR